MRIHQTFCLFLLLAAAPPLAAQTLELRSGEVIIGHVVDVNDQAVKVEVAYPTSGVRTIQRDELKPRSIYEALASRIDENDGAAHLQLARECEKLGLFAYGLAECSEAKKLDVKTTAAADRLLHDLHEAISAHLLEHAEAAFADERVGSARMAANMVLQEYRNTTAAEGARELLRKIAASGLPATHQATLEQAKDAIERTEKVLEKTAKDTAVPVHGKMRDQRHLQRAIKQLEDVWERVGDLAAPETEHDIADRLTAVQAELKHRLVDAYLALGTIYLEREALVDAEEWCNKACDMDPENKPLHQLHGLILQAKIVSGWNY